MHSALGQINEQTVVSSYIVSNMQINISYLVSHNCREFISLSTCNTARGPLVYVLEPLFIRDLRRKGVKLFASRSLYNMKLFRVQSYSSSKNSTQKYPNNLQCGLHLFLLWAHKVYQWEDGFGLPDTIAYLPYQSQIAQRFTDLKQRVRLSQIIRMMRSGGYQ